MWESLLQLNPMVVFLFVGTTGFGFLLVSLLFGESLEGLDADGDLDADFDDERPGVLSLKVISVFMTAWGYTGGLGVYTGFNFLWSSIFGMIAGAAIAGAVHYFGRLHV